MTLYSGKSSFLLGAIVFCICISACSRKINFNRSSIVPAAEGRVIVKGDKNKNNVITIRVRHLAQPSSLPIPASVYVVWMETTHRNENLGQLRITNNFLNKSLKASLKTVSSFVPQRIFITAENNAASSYPSGTEILTTKNF